MSSVRDKYSMVQVYQHLRIPKGDQKQLRTVFGIDTLTKLIQRRNELALSRNPSCRLLAFTVDYIVECCKNDDASVHDLLFTSPAFVVFLALKILLAQLPHQRQLTTEGGVLTSKNAGKASPQIIYKQGDQYWENAKDKTSEEDNEGSEEELLFGHGSTWQLSPDGLQVLLSADPGLIRLPVKVFRDSFLHQRDGVAWIAGLWRQEIGGILAE
jgi:hypothetical protein